MRTPLPSLRAPHPRRGRSALTLIELIGVLAVIATLAAVLVPAFVRQADQVAADRESAVLKTLADGLQQSIRRHRYIPGSSDWSGVIAVEAGLNLTGVATNARRQPRIFLIDPNLHIGTNAADVLPYRQDVRGSLLPNSPRLILLSSIGPALAGTPSGVDFDGIWNWIDSSPLPPTNAVFATLRRGEDLRVQRIHLDSLFVNLNLTTNSSPDLAKYSISTNAVNSQIGTVPSTGINSYFILGSVLGLYTNSGTGPLDSQQILTGKGSYIYEGGAWRNSLLGPWPASGVGGGSGGMFASAYSIVTNFLAAPPNRGNGASNQMGVVQSMINYMNAYDAWAGSKFTNTFLYATAVSNQVILNQAAQGLCCNPIPPEYAP